MRLITSFCVAMGIVIGLTPLTLCQQPMPKDHALDAKNLQGAWVQASFDGVPVKNPRTIRFEGKKVTGLFRNEQKKGFTLEYHLLSDRKTKGIDVGPFPQGYGPSIHGIYDIEGDVLKLVFRPKLDARHIPPGLDAKDNRPNTFDPNLVHVEVWRRQHAK